MNMLPWSNTPLSTCCYTIRGSRPERRVEVVQCWQNPFNGLVLMSSAEPVDIISNGLLRCVVRLVASVLCEPGDILVRKCAGVDPTMPRAAARSENQA